MLVKKPWFEIHRPVSVDDVIFADAREEKAFKNIVTTGELPNLLIHGPSGTGKSSLSGALLRDLDIDTMDRLRINCSDEKIDAMRDKVRAFAMTMPIGRSATSRDTRPEYKVVQLEEFDYLSLDAQGLLRSLIEDVSGSCRFIATCNYLNKVIPALQSRFQVHEFKAPNREQVLERAAVVLETQKVEADIDDIEKIVEAGYPDLRKIITLLEQNSTQGRLEITATNAATDWKLGLLPLLETADFKAARKLVCDSATKEELVDAYRFLYDNIHRVKSLKGKHDQAVVLIAQYQYQHAFVSDPEIQLAALFIELGALA
jgi:DNA polymerase III delta prime subunit